ncbi:DUF4129 domain-containing protein [Actinomyces faecalis]|uniref:DUF4129 domain-containing protein n=1 Tax=Actinomyces faecalis TaxID=2722820 RepID=UPI001553D156|nr:DUF4129 domain-containing protein [Actinomyces faecalis]
MEPGASTTTWRRLVLCAGVLAVVLVAWASTDTAPLVVTGSASTRPQPASAPTATVPPLQPATPPDLPHGTGTSWWVEALVVMAVLVAGVLACLAIWRLVRFLLVRLRRLRPVPVDVQAEGLGPDLALLSPSQAARQVTALQHGSPANAIVAAWMQLERDVTEAGVGTRPHETSAELVLRVLAQREVPATAIRDLAALYREARFSSHELAEDARDQARWDLEQVHAALGLSGRPVPEPDEAARSEVRQR